MSSIRIVRDYPHPPTKVWRALTEPALIALWGMRPEGFSTQQGARFRFVGTPNPHWRGFVECELLEARAPSLLRYAWVGDADGERTVVTYTLEATATGTRLTFEHAGFEGAESVAVAMQIMKPGWEKTFDVELPPVLADLDDAGYLLATSTLAPKFPAAAAHDRGAGVSAYDLSVGHFVPLLTTLGELLDLGVAHAKASGRDPDTLLTARLAPDMYPLATQVRFTCRQAKDAVAHLVAEPAPERGEDDATMGGLKQRVADAIARLAQRPRAAFDAAGERTIVIPLPESRELALTGYSLLLEWAIPQAYFHYVTAYAILRHEGVPLGKIQYMSRVRPFLRARSG